MKNLGQADWLIVADAKGWPINIKGWLADVKGQAYKPHWHHGDKDI